MAPSLSSIDRKRGKAAVTDVAIRRVENETRGLGYWAAVDFLRKHSPSKLAALLATQKRK